MNPYVLRSLVKALHESLSSLAAAQMTHRLETTDQETPTLIVSSVGSTKKGYDGPHVAIWRTVLHHHNDPDTFGIYIVRESASLLSGDHQQIDKNRIDSRDCSARKVAEQDNSPQYSTRTATVTPSQHRCISRLTAFFRWHYLVLPPHMQKD